MAEIPYVAVTPLSDNSNRVGIITWGIPTNVVTPGGQSNTPKTPLVTPAAIVVGSTCQPIFIPGWVDRCVQVDGTLDGATLVMQGSNDGVLFHTLHDSFGNSLNGVQPGTIFQLMESAAWIQWSLTGGGDTTSLAIVMKMRAAF